MYQGFQRFVTVLALIALAAPATADTYWPMHDSWAIDHDIRSRFGDAPNWCGTKLVAGELVKQAEGITRFVVTGQKIATVTNKDVRASANDSLVVGNHSYGFWHPSVGRTFAIDIECNSPTVCVLNAHLIVGGGDDACIERIRTVVYKGDKPPANLPKPDLYATPHAQDLP